jgi:hypothetical protein
METNGQAHRSEPGFGAALLAFAVFALIAAGSLILARRSESLPGYTGSANRAIQSPDGSRLEMVAVLRRAHFRSDTASFRHGEVVTIAGRSSLDLSDARMAEDGGKLEVVVMGGRARVKVPPEWAVEARDSLVLGGLRNQARQAENLPARTLRLEAVVLGGMLEVTH